MIHNVSIAPKKCSLKPILAGFTLIELLIVMAIIIVLLVFAYPSYNHHIAQVRRHQANVGLLQLASQLENYSNINNSYVGATLEELGMSTDTPDHSYTFKILSLAATSYLIAAEPQGYQAYIDAQCGSLELDEMNNQQITGTGTAEQCW